MKSTKLSEEPGVAVTKAYNLLRETIVEGGISPGARINIDAVARDLGLSQTPVREALQRLEADDLLVYSPGKGYRTTPVLDIDSLNSLFEFRLLVEPWAARVVASDRLPNPGDVLTKELARFEKKAGKGGDIRLEVMNHDSFFHSAIINATGNSVISQAFDQTHCHLHLFRLYPVDLDGTIALSEHREISEAIADCDPQRAEAAMVKHIKASYQRSIAVFDNSGKLSADADGNPRVDETPRIIRR